MTARPDQLRQIMTLTDSALSRLSARDLLEEVLDRVREALGAETAAVSLLDPGSQHLVATAARGIEEEVRQGVRVPVGQGFAGRIAAELRPVTLDTADDPDVLTTVLLDHGIRSLLGVPLLAAGRLLGVLYVGSPAPREFDNADVELLQVAAERAALAVQSLMARDDRLAVAALQRSLMPPAPPVVAGMRMAARYVTGDGVVGGDWYDILTLPSGKLGVVVGDVAGSGLPAAVIMGRMRSALRAYVLETDSPAEALTRLDRKIQYFEPDVMATVMFAILDADTGIATVSSAGHLPPVIATTEQAAAPAKVESDPPIGVAENLERADTVLDLPVGALACFYTDGLIERRGQSLTDGIGRLCAALDGAARGAGSPPSPEQGCAAVMRALIGAGEASDDVALLIAQRV